MNGESLDIIQQRKALLESAMPEVFTEGKVDCERLKAALGEEMAKGDERYVLNWAGKSDAFRVLQTTTTATLVPAREESVNFDETENIFIEGENLEVLKVLQRSYYGKIKMIYIDPPYNTGNDSFIYPDRFAESKDEYLKRIGDKDEEGYLLKEGMFRKNSKENGHYHSNWLSMMYPRLFLARNLLKDDGVIFVSIDDNEVHNLRMVMNEVFGEENFLAALIWEKIHSIKNDAKYFSDNHEYVLCFCKEIESVNIQLLPRTEVMNERYQNPDNDPRGPWSSGDLVANEERRDGRYDVKGPTGKIFNVPIGKHWVTTKDNMFDLVADKRIWFGNDGDAFPRLKRFLSEVQQGRKPSTIMPNEEVGHNQEAKREVKAIFDGHNYFDTPKPCRLVERFLALSTKNDAGHIVLDFFAGSCTTAHAVMHLNKEDKGNRKYICVQLPENLDNDSEAMKAGHKSIADIGKERVRKVISDYKHERESNLDIEKNIDLSFKVFKLKPSNFKIWHTKASTIDELTKQLDTFVDPTRLEATEENMLYELLIKTGQDLNSKVEKYAYEGAEYYSINNGALVVALSKITESVINEIVGKKPQKAILLDKLFAGNDQLKTNTALQMKDAGIEFKTI